MRDGNLPRRRADLYITAETAHGTSSCRIGRMVWEDFGLHFSFVDSTKIENIASAVTPHTKMVFVETPSNPLMQITDLSRVAAIAHEHGALLVVDASQGVEAAAVLVGGSRIELLAPTGEDTPVGRFLARRGRDFGGVVQRAARQAMHLAASLANGFVAETDEFIIERARGDLPEAFPARFHVALFSEAVACVPRVL